MPQEGRQFRVLVQQKTTTVRAVPMWGINTGARIRTTSRKERDPHDCSAGAVTTQQTDVLFVQKKEEVSFKFSSVQFKGLTWKVINRNRLFTSDIELQDGLVKKGLFGEMAHSIKCLPYIYEDSSLTHRAQKKLGIMVYICNLGAGEAEIGIPRAD